MGVMVSSPIVCKGELSISPLEDCAGFEPQSAAGLGFVLAGGCSAAANKAHKVFPRLPATLKGEWVEHGPGLWVSTVLVGSCVRCAPPRVLCPGAEGAGIWAVGGPHAHVKVKEAAGGRVGGGHVQSGLNRLPSAVGGVPLGHVLFFGDPLVGASAPRSGGPVSQVVVAGVY